MKIKGCCVRFLGSWDSVTVHPIVNMELTCTTCEQHWQLEKLDRKDGSGFAYLISWTKVKKPKEALDD